MRTAILGVLAGMTLAMSGAVALASQKAEKIRVEEDSRSAAIIIRTQKLDPAPGHKTAYRIELQQYHPDEQRVGGRGLTIKAQPKLFYGDGYLVADIKPGTYAFREVSVQDFWAVCFHDNSRSFTVKAGEVLYLGDFNALLHVAQIQHEAQRSFRVVTMGNRLVHFFDRIRPPAVSKITPESLDAAKAFALEFMPRTTVEPTAATFNEARFGTGSDLFGGSRSCGGWHQGKAKPKPDTE